MPVDAFGPVSPGPHPSATAGRYGSRAPHSMPLAAVLAMGAVLAGCGGGSTPTGGVTATTTPTARHSVAAPATTGATARDACRLVSASDLRSLGVTGTGVPTTVTVGTAAVYGCTWGHPPANELHLQFEPLDPAAASQVRRTFGGAGTVVPGVGDSARGQFGSVLAALSFFKASTFVSLQLFGTGAGGHKDAFISVAKDVASHL